MKKEKIKVYTYKRVSTAMQIDGYSLDAQRARMKAYADFNDYEIVGEYEDAGKSGEINRGAAAIQTDDGRCKSLEKITSRMYWCSSFPDSGEMRGCAFNFTGYAGFWGKT